MYILNGQIAMQISLIIDIENHVLSGCVTIKMTHCYNLSWVAPTTSIKKWQISQFRKLSHTIWHCQYHIHWTPKYRLRILSGQVAEEVSKCIRFFFWSERKRRYRAKNSDWSCSPDCSGASQDFDIRFCGHNKRLNSYSSIE